MNGLMTCLTKPSFKKETLCLGAAVSAVLSLPCSWRTEAVKDSVIGITAKQLVQPLAAPPRGWLSLVHYQMLQDLTDVWSGGALEVQT